MSAKKINLVHDDIAYTLSFTRDSIRKLEQSGFRLGDLEDKPMTTIPRLFHGAFQARHPFIKQKITDEILENIKDKENLLSNLIEMYSEPLVTLLGEPEENEVKNVEWEATW